MIEKMNDKWERQQIMGYACYRYIPDDTEWRAADELAEEYDVSVRDMRINIRRGYPPDIRHGFVALPQPAQSTYTVPKEGKLIGTAMNGERIGSKAAQVFASLSFRAIRS